MTNQPTLETPAEPKPRAKQPRPAAPLTPYNVFVRVVSLTLAALWRRLMFRTRFIAVTGSVGKTTAKDCIAAILASRGRVQSTPGSDNHYRGIGMTIFHTRPWHRYAVVETAIGRPGQMKWFAKIVRPDVAVWLGVARTHTLYYESLAQIASEKSLLPNALRPGGVAVLNDDDPFVRAYQPPPHARALRFGRDPSAALWADQIESSWPARLSFRVHHGDRSARVETRLVGTHWVPSVLAAIAVALECGFSLEDAVPPLAHVEPFAARLSPETLPSGAVLLRDDTNGSIDTYDRAMEVLRDAKADRKILAISDLSDVGERWQLRSRRIGVEAARYADIGIFIGEHGAKTARNAIAAGMNPGHAFSFVSLPPAVEFLKRELRAGDLLLVKGRGSDKLSRLSLALTREVTCWRTTCQFRDQCDFCKELARPPSPQ